MKGLIIMVFVLTVILAGLVWEYDHAKKKTDNLATLIIVFSVPVVLIWSRILSSKEFWDALPPKLSETLAYVIAIIIFVSIICICNIRLSSVLQIVKRKISQIQRYND